MDNLRTTLPSGTTLEVSLSSFEECERLLSAVMQEAELVKFDIGQEFKGLKEMVGGDVSAELINTLKNVLCRVIRSEAIKTALTPCMARALYNNQKIGKETFEAADARQDYFIVLKEVLWYNLSPFFGKNGLKLTGIFKPTDASTQK